MTDSLPDLAQQNADQRRLVRRDLLVVGLLGLLLHLPFLGQRDLWSSAEARVAQVARQMRTGDSDWIVPMLGDDERLKKPPLAYWLTVGASLPFDDIDEFNSRLPSAAGAVGVMLLVYLLGLDLMGRRAGLLSALAVGTTAITWWYGRTTGIEAPLLFFNTLALFAWWKYHARRDNRGEPVRPLPWLLVCYFALGLSLLQKGPIGPPLVLLIVWIYLLVSGRIWQERPRITHHLAGLGVMLALALPWPILVLHQMPEAWDVWFRESAGRFEGFDHIKSWHYFIRMVLGDGQPWVLIALLAPLLLQSCSIPERRRVLFPLVWAAVTLIFFSIPASKKSYYVMPIYPALALMAGMVLATADTNAASKVHDTARKLLFLLGGILTLLGLAVLPARHVLLDLHEQGRVEFSIMYLEHWPTIILGTVAALGLGVALLVCARRRDFFAAAWAVVGAFALVFTALVQLTPMRNQLEKADKLVCTWLRPHLKASDRVYTYGISGAPIMSFYTNRDVTRIESPVLMYQIAQEQRTGESYVLIGENDRDRFRCMFIIRPTAAQSAGDPIPTLQAAAAAIAERLSQNEAVTVLQSYSIVQGATLAQTEDAQGTSTIVGPATLLVQVREQGENGKWRWAPERAQEWLATQLEGCSYVVVPLADRFQRLNHPDSPNGANWHRAVPSAFDNTPAADGLVDGKSAVAE